MGQKKSKKSSKWSRVARTKLESSGLTTKDAELLGIEEMSPERTARLFSSRAIVPHVPALLLNYFSAAGELRDDVFRVRLLEQPKGGFGQIDETRYLQPQGTPPAVYWPKTVPWDDILSDTSKTILITEGELKAACAAKHHYPCLGLGGVWSWRSKKHGQALLPELQEVTWVQREVIVVFDADLEDNPQVQLAANALTRELRRLGALIRVVYVPPLEDLAEPGKAGLDDLVVQRGPQALDELIESATESEGLDQLGEMLWQFNERFAVVVDPGAVYDAVSDKLHAFKRWKESHSNRTAVIPTPNGSREVLVASHWLKWPLRRTVEGLVFEPGSPMWFCDSHGHARLNLWRGWACEPEAGSVAPWYDLLNILFGDDVEAQTWFNRWCLYPLRYPGTKCLSCVGVWSLATGQGKSLIGDTLKLIHGKGYSMVTQNEVEDKFTDWVLGKTFVMVDDVSSYDSRSKADNLKSMITGDTIEINTKGVPKYTMPNRCNFYMTSNRANAYHVEPNDRRYFIHEVLAPSPTDFTFYDRYHTWLSREGPAALLYHAMYEVDFGDWDPVARPPLTAAKRDMIESSRTDAEQWVAELEEDSVGIMGEDRDIFTAQEIHQKFEGEHRGRPVSLRALAIVLRAKFGYINRDGGRLLIRGRRGRYYAIRNMEKWRRASTKACMKHIEKGMDAEAAGKKF